MLQITPLKAGKANAKWEYYSREFAGVWGGRGAELLGLRGEARRREFNDLAGNRMPGTRNRVTQRTKQNRRLGYDFCFDVPKSLSIYIADTGDKKMQRLIQESVVETMKFIEREMETTVRIGGAKSNRVTGNMVYAIFRHSMSRPVSESSDPQHHAHIICINCTYDSEEQRWKAGQFGAIKKNGAQHQKAYHELLISKLKANGYRIRRTEHAFELSSISRETIEKFSKRTRIINEVARVRYEEIKVKAARWAKSAGLKVTIALAKIKATFGVATRERKSRKKLNPFEQLLSWRKQMTSEERNSVRQAMPVHVDRVPHKMPHLFVKVKQVDREQGRER